MKNTGILTTLPFLATGFLGSAAFGQTLGHASIPSGLTLYGNTMAVGLSGSHGPLRGVGPNATRFDASTTLSFGAGDPSTSLGVQFDLVNTSFRNFGASGYFAISASRSFQLNESSALSVALSATHLGGWGDSAGQSPGYSLVSSVGFPLNDTLAIATLGIANNLNAARDWQPIVGFGVNVAPEIALSAGYVGDQTAFGMIWQPSAMANSSISLSVRGIEDPARRTIGVDLTHAFSLFGI